MRTVLSLAVSAAITLSTKLVSAQACVPGAQVSCACPGGPSGVQVCADDGKRLGPCQCAPPSAAPPLAPPTQPATQPPLPQGQQPPPQIQQPPQATPQLPQSPPQVPQQQPYPSPPQQGITGTLCADPSDPRCAGGGASSTTVFVPVQLHRLGRVAIEGYAGGAFAAAANGDGTLSTHIWGGGVDAGLCTLIGFQPQFPGGDGGNWQGLDLRAMGGFYGAGVVYSQGTATTGAGALMGMGYLTAGYEFIHFGKMNTVEFLQRGIGAFVGGRFGFQFTDIIASGSRGGVDPTAGATIALVLPEYHAQKGRLVNADIIGSFWVLPGTGLTFYSFGGGAEF